VTFRSYTLRELRRRPGRTLLTLLGIIIGVAAVVAVSLATATARDAYRTMFDSVGGRAELEVVAGAGHAFDPAVGLDLAEVEGVEWVVPVVQAQAALLTDTGRASVLALGVDPELDGLVRDYDMREGTPLSGASDGGGGPVEVLLEAGFADSLGVSAGAEVRVLAPTGLAEAVVAGLVDSPGAAAFNGGAVLFTNIGDARRLFAVDGANSLQLVLAQGVAVRTVEERVSAMLPVDLLVQTPASRGDLARDSVADTEAGLSSLSGLALVAFSLVAAAGLLLGTLPATTAPPLFMTLVTGCVLVIPLITPALTRFWAAALVPVLGMAGRLAFRQLELPARRAVRLDIVDALHYE